MHAAVAVTSATVRRIIPGVLPCLLGAVAAHAVTGVLVHVGSLGGPDAVHAVHAPTGVLAAVAVVLLATRRRVGGQDIDRWAGLLTKAVVTTGYLAAEAVAAEGYGAHLLHDPWILLAPVGVLLAHVATWALAAAVVASMQKPVTTQPHLLIAVRLKAVGWFCDRLSVWSRPGTRGRGPPALALR